jgi:hypothetical protein
MARDCPYCYPTAPALVRLLASGHFLLRPQLLTRLKVLPRAGLS